MSAVTPRWTAFDGMRRLAAGAPADVALAVARAVAAGAEGPVLVFDDVTGAQLDLDLRGTEAEIAARHAPPAEAPPAPRGPGRPKLGVVAREVTLLPRHWEWLAEQPGGASVALRKLVDDARRRDDAGDRARRAHEAAYKVMHALAGNLPHFEEASRALFAGDRARFAYLTSLWPRDVAGHVAQLAFE